MSEFLNPGGPWEGGGHGWVPEGAIPGMGFPGCGRVFPGVPPGALLAGPQPDGLGPRQLGRGQGALVRQRIDGLQ